MYIYVDMPHTVNRGEFARQLRRTEAAMVKLKTDKPFLLASYPIAVVLPAAIVSSLKEMISDIPFPGST